MQRTAWPLEEFERNNFAGPFRAFSGDEIERIRDVIETDVLTHEGPVPSAPRHSRHLDSSIVFSLCSAPPIVDALRAVLGPNLMIWRSEFWEKKRDMPELPWHRDAHYFGVELNPMINVTAWLALERVTAESGCLRLIPGSSNIPFGELHVTPVKGLLPNLKPGRFIDVPQREAENAAVMEMEAGEFIVFDKELVHCSRENPTGTRRLALGMRITQASVDVNHDAIIPGHACIMIAGESTNQSTRMQAPPTTRYKGAES
jgi:ectoine hydroxylase-related dioxygenase (phytanoyl-CoA dioxygenase family)